MYVTHVYLYQPNHCHLLLLKCNTSFSNKGKTIKCNAFLSKSVRLCNIPKKILFFHKLSIKGKKKKKKIYIYIYNTSFVSFFPILMLVVVLSSPFLIFFPLLKVLSHSLKWKNKNKNKKVGKKIYIFFYQPPSHAKSSSTTIVEPDCVQCFFVRFVYFKMLNYLLSEYHCFQLNCFIDIDFFKSLNPQLSNFKKIYIYWLCFYIHLF